MKDKIAFVIAFLGVFIALTPFKNTLLGIELDYGFYKTNIYTLLFIPLSLLFLAAYFYALDYTKYGFSLFDGWRIFKYFELTANTLYLFAILSPVLIIVTYIIIQLFSLIPIKDFRLEFISYFLNIIAIIFTIIISIKTTIRIRKSQREAREETLENSAINVEQEARKLFEEKKWNLSIIESYRLMEIAINKKLLDLGIDAKRIPIIRALDILIKYGVLSRDDFHKINLVRSLRNEAAHSNKEFTLSEVENVFEITNNILPKLKNHTNFGQKFEENIIQLLSGDGGLFPRHHLSPPQSNQLVGYDLLAEGPLYNYLIEIKSSSNKRTINRALHQLQKYLSDKSRGIIILPKIDYEFQLGGDRIKFLYYDVENNCFTNRDEIYNWIYKKTE